MQWILDNSVEWPDCPVCAVEEAFARLGFPTLIVVPADYGENVEPATRLGGIEVSI